MSYSRDNIKLSFFKDNTRFFVNEKKGIVSCVVAAEMNVPYNFDAPVDIPWKTFKGTGIAKCRHDDKFDVERGKRIALAKAENNVYLDASRYLNGIYKHLEFFMSRINDFNEKGLRHCVHNEDYIESIHNPEHSRYKVTVNPIKHGFTNNKPNFVDENEAEAQHVIKNL